LPENSAGEILSRPRLSRRHRQAAPATCVFNNQLFAFWKANDTSNRIFVSGSSTGAPNSSPAGKVINGSDSTSAAPAACVFNNQLFVFWKSDDPSNRIFVSAGQ
jgi:hypothetical protein